MLLYGASGSGGIKCFLMISRFFKKTVPSQVRNPMQLPVNNRQNKSIHPGGNSILKK